MNETRKVSFEEFHIRTNAVDRIKLMLSYATLAPSTHNTQPWKFYVEEDKVHIHYDPELKLPQADPLGRYMLISVGALLEHLLIVAEYYGVLDYYRIDIDTTTKVAEVGFINLMHPPQHVDASSESLIHEIPKRNNVRACFQTGEPSIALEHQLHRYCADDLITLTTLTNQHEIESIAKLTETGTILANCDKDFRREISQWMVPSRSDRRDGLNGTLLGFNDLFSYLAPSVVRNFNLGTKIAAKHKEQILSSSMVCMFSAADNTAATWLRTGQRAAQCMLHLKAAGFGSSVYTAALEYGDLTSELQQLSQSSKIPQFLLVAGKSDQLPKIYSKRHDVDDKIMHVSPSLKEASKRPLLNYLT